MRKILVPTDLSATAETGLRLAAEIARRCGASISLVNFTRHPYGPTFSATGDITLRSDPEGDLEAIEGLKLMKARMEELVAKYRDASFAMDIAIVDNAFKNGIDEYLQTEQIDLVVMGTSGEQNIKEAFTGNHTEQAIRVSACPVLSVKDGFVTENLSRIVVGVDVLTDNKSADGLAEIRSLAECFHAKVYLAHVRSRASDSTLVLDQYFNQMAQIAGLQNYVVRILESEDVAEGLSAFAREVNAGLIAVIKNAKEGIFRIFSSSFSDRMIKEESTPVVTVKL